MLHAAFPLKLFLTESIWQQSASPFNNHYVYKYWTTKSEWGEELFPILLIMLLSVVFYFYNSDKIFKCRSTVNLKELHFVKTFHFIDKFLSLGKNLWWIYNSFKLIFPPSLVANTFFQAIYMQISIDTKESEWGKQTSYTTYITVYFLKSTPFSKNSRRK